MQLTLHPREQRGGLLVFENRIATGQTHVLALRVCPDPVCRCEHLFVIGAAEPSEPTSLEDVPTWRVDLDLGERRVQVPNEQQGDTASVAVAKAIQTEITADQWTELRRFYKAWKEEQTEKADLDQLETHFPPEAADGSMVGYYEILPHARPIEVRVEEQAWQFDDQYCVQRGCGCQSAGLTFIPVMGEGSQRNAGPRLRLGFRYSYNDGQADHVTAGADAPSVSEMLGALRKAQPDLKAFLARRHSQLRRLYRRASSATPAADSVRPTSPKTGRNDPCPCGSGKKYKRCCGAA